MSEIVDTNGEIVEDSISGSQPNALPEIYQSLRDNKNLAYAVNDAIGDSDSEKWASLLNNVEVFGHSLGKVQGVAVKTPLSTYNNKINDRCVPLYEVSDSEKQEIKSEKIMDKIDSPNNWWEYADDVQVPTDQEGERLPVIVTTNEYSERFHTFEEAKKILAGVLSRIEGVEAEDFLDESNETAGSSDSKTTTDESDSVNDPTNIGGIGPNTIEKIENGGFDVVPANDIHEKIEVEPFEFEKSDGTTAVPELLTSEVKERYDDVKDEMDEMDTEIVRERIISGDLHDAVDTIENYE